MASLQDSIKIVKTCYHFSDATDTIASLQDVTNLLKLVIILVMLLGFTTGQH